MEEIVNLDWQQPIPLITETKSSQQNYPLDSLPDIIKEAIIAYQEYAQQPTPKNALLSWTE